MLQNIRENLSFTNIKDWLDASINEYKKQAYMPTEEQILKKFWKERTWDDVLAVPNVHRSVWLYDTLRECYQEGASPFWDWEDNDKRVYAAAKLAEELYITSLMIQVTKKRFPDGACRNLKYNKRKRKHYCT